MTEATDPALLALLAEAKAHFAAGLPAKVAELEELLARQAWEGLRRAAHKLRGSSGTYGFADVSAAAADIEEALLAANGPPGAEARELLAERAHRIGALVARLSAGGGAP